MNDKTLLKISIIISFFGIISLILMLYFEVIPRVSISQINYVSDDTLVSVIGFVKNIRQLDKITIITIDNKCTIEAVYFNKEPSYDSSYENDLELVNGQEIEIIGKISSYQNKKQLLIEKINTYTTKE